MFRLFKLLLPRINLIFSLLEASALFGVVCLAAAVRFMFDPTDFAQYLERGLFLKAALVTVVCVVLLHYHDLMYHVTQLRRRGMGLQLMQALGLAMLALFVLYYWSPELSLGRGVFFLVMPMILGVSATLRLVYLHVTQKPTFGEKMLILGSQEMARRVGREVLARPDLGYRVSGFIDENPANIGKPVLNPKVIGSYENLSEVIRAEKIQTVVVALPDKRGKLPVQDLLQLKLHGVKILDGISFYEGVTGKIALEELKPSWLIFSDGFGRPGTVLMAKRCLDLVLASFGLLLVLPFLPLIALLIKLDSPGPIFYSQERLGEKGRLFNVIKFRSMRADAEQKTGPVWAQEDDPRITSVGQFIRRMRIDELPQLWNVLRGEMSLVGPRPERPNFDKELGEGVPYYTLRLSAKPGITGWAQVRYQYGSSIKDALEKMQYDLYYIKHMSISFDLLIIFQTIKIVLLGRGAK